MKSIGIDGCKSGWLAVSLEDAKVESFNNINEIFNKYQNGYLFLIDIPIGLPSSKCIVRNCETLARNILTGNRKFSVFTVPCREAVYSDSYDIANKINKKILLKGISKQAWSICSKIKELDRLIIAKKEMRSKVKESHPEVAFHYLNNGKSMRFNKKSEAGLGERLELLMKYNNNSKTLFENALLQFKRKDVAKDDILDAICLAITQSKIGNYNKPALPTKPNKDEKGIEMEIYFYNPTQ